MKQIYLILFSACAMLLGVNSAAMAEDFDSSNYFSNLDFEGGETYTPWTLSWDNITTNWPAATTEYMSSLVSGNYVLEVWEGKESKTVAADTKICSQTSTSALPAGTYTVSAVVHFDGTGSFALYATANGETVKTDIKTNSDWADATNYTVDIELTQSSTLEIGIISTADITLTSSTEFNLYIDNFAVEEKVEDDATDISDTAFSNLGFEGGETYTPWTLSWDNITTNWPAATTEYMSSLVSGNYVLEVWEGKESKTVAADTKICSQTSNSTLPVGTYTVSAVVHFDGTGSFALYAAANGETVKTDISANSTWGGATEYTATIDLTESGTLEIGIITTEDITLTSDTEFNLYIDNFKVTQKTSGTTGINAIQEAVSTSNAIYNIQGMRVSDMSKKGLYIVNGKKIAVK